MNAFAVITSIHAPTGAVAEWTRKGDWKVVVAADRKTPADWTLTNARFLRFDEQTSAFGRALPENHYARKMLGYMHAIVDGADVILDTDDDNYPDPGWNADQFFDANGGVMLSSAREWINIHAVYGHDASWPRGFPLAAIGQPEYVTRSSDPSQLTRVGIWQGLVNTEPDIDAIYRLTRKDRPIFKDHGLVALGVGHASPFNSQNTLFRRVLFPLLYLPCTVTFRFTDILRGIVAQPIMWAAGYHLGFSAPNAMQRRNAHDLMADFRSEVPVYTQVEEALAVVKRAVQTSGTISIHTNLTAAYRALADARIVERDELRLLQEWLNAITP